jgi:hypothetical protein
MEKLKYKQHLPDYIHKFKEDTRWKTLETEHYIFNFFLDSVAEKEIKNITERQEQAYKKIIGFLEISEPTQKIIYYLYSDEQTKKELMGDDWYAQAIYNENCVHVLYTEKIKPIGEHEDTHLLSLSWGLSIPLFQEGLAEYLVGYNWYGEDHNKCVKEGWNQSFELSLSNLMDNDSWLAIPDEMALFSYCIVGSFVTFLIEKYGKEKFKELYQETDRENTAEKNKKIFKEIYGVSIDEIEKLWKKGF